MTRKFHNKDYKQINRNRFVGKNMKRKIGWSIIILTGIVIIGLILEGMLPIVAGVESGPFKHEQQWTYDFDVVSQEGIASNDNGIFFITSSDKVHVAMLDEINNEFVYTSINGIRKWEIKTWDWDHLGDPFCDNNYLFVPWSNSKMGKTIPTEAKCYVYDLSNLKQLNKSPFELRNGDGNYLKGASSGAYYNKYYYFSTYWEDPSCVYKFSFHPDNGFQYSNDYSLGKGKSEVQGIEFMDDKCYFIRAHGKDPHVYWINANNWDVTNIDEWDLKSLSGNKNGPFEGITFDTSEENKCIAYFGFGSTGPAGYGYEVFEAFELLPDWDENMNDGGDDAIPGFEFVFLIIAIAIILFKWRNNKNR